MNSFYFVDQQLHNFMTIVLWPTYVNMLKKYLKQYILTDSRIMFSNKLLLL
jgi:hypothetical protein